MPELPQAHTWILSKDVTFADIEDVARAEADANGWAVVVSPVVVDGQDAALVVFSLKKSAADAGSVMPAGSTAAPGAAPSATKTLAAGAPAAPAVADGLAGGTGPSAFAEKLATIARREFEEFHTLGETDARLASRIEEYWSDLGLDFPGVNTAWSAVFVSWCVKQAGASAAEFAFSAAHSVFAHRAIANARAGTGVFRGMRIGEYAPKIGDIVQNNRGGNHFGFDFAASHVNYKSHSAIVIAIEQAGDARFATTVGGNESESIRTSRIPLNSNGFIVQRAASPFICVIRDLK